MADECVQIGDVLHCRCGNPSSHYGTMGIRGVREAREETAQVEKERFCWEQAFQRASDELVEQAANARAGAAAIRVLEAEIERLKAERDTFSFKQARLNAGYGLREFADLIGAVPSRLAQFEAGLPVDPNAKRPETGGGGA